MNFKVLDKIKSLTAKLGFVAAELESTARVKELNEIGSYEDRYALLEPYVDALTEIARSTEEVKKKLSQEEDVMRMYMTKARESNANEPMNPLAVVMTLSSEPALTLPPASFRSFMEIFDDGLRERELSSEAMWIHDYLVGVNFDAAEIELSTMLTTAGVSGKLNVLAKEYIARHWIDKGHTHLHPQRQYDAGRIVEYGILLWDKDQAENGAAPIDPSISWRPFKDIRKDSRQEVELSWEAVQAYEFLFKDQETSAILELSGMFARHYKSTGTYKTVAKEIITEYWNDGVKCYSEGSIKRDGLLIWDKHQHLHGGDRP